MTKNGSRVTEIDVVKLKGKVWTALSCNLSDCVDQFIEFPPIGGEAISYRLINEAPPKSTEDVLDDK